MLPVVCMELEVTGVVGHCLCRVTADTQHLWVRAASSEETSYFWQVAEKCCSQSYRAGDSTCALKFTLWKVCAPFQTGRGAHGVCSLLRNKGFLWV